MSGLRSCRPRPDAPGDTKALPTPQRLSMTGGPWSSRCARPSPPCACPRSPSPCSPARAPAWAGSRSQRRSASATCWSPTATCAPRRRSSPAWPPPPQKDLCPVWRKHVDLAKATPRRSTGAAGPARTSASNCGHERHGRRLRAGAREAPASRAEDGRWEGPSAFRQQAALPEERGDVGIPAAEVAIGLLRDRRRCRRRRCDRAGAAPAPGSKTSPVSSKAAKASASSTSDQR